MTERPAVAARTFAAHKLFLFRFLDGFHFTISSQISYMQLIKVDVVLSITLTGCIPSSERRRVCLVNHHLV